MKKLILICTTLLFAATVFADGYKTCKVSGTTGTVVVSVYETNTENGTASVQFSNDTNEPANVNASITFSLVGGGAITRNISKRVPAQFELSVDVSCGKPYKNATVSSVSGNKCK